MEKLMLWDGIPPYSNTSFENSENRPYVPSLTPFIVPTEKDENGKAKRTGCVIVCPGGGYEIRADYEGDPICEFFNTYGISAFTLNYRVYPYDHNAILPT